ncbi:MAG: indolepyruvate oxidoreductase subunit beta [candidate division WOR-3 bacterium]|nr:indolepyruvate oxidoreductase subunit beta [candidate division WOR-3 bacterium]
MVKRIIIAGVGGQGILLASDILSEVCMEAGFDVKKSEVHGMSQRGGDVVSHVVYGEKVYSPLIGEGDADVILSFEKIEALRNIDFLKKDGVMIINKMEIKPLPVASGLADYPKNPIDDIKKHVNNVIVVDGQKEAEQIGNIRVMNVILLGILASHMDIKKELFVETVKKKVPPKTVDMNIEAFNFGYSYSG